MKLLIPISFFNASHSEIWQLDCKTKQQKKLTSFIDKKRAVNGKGITGLAWLNSTELVGCDFNRLFIIDRKTLKILSIYTDNELNDLHHICVNENNIYVANTGRDSIERYNDQLSLVERIDNLSPIEWKNRIAGKYKITGDYYDKDIKKPFYQRKIPDKYHFNHVEILNKQLVITSFTKKQLVDGRTLENLGNTLPERLHDGFIYQNKIWITLVSGQVYFSSLKQPFQFKLFFDLFKKAPVYGWCRGLLINDGKLYIGITTIYDKKRTPWLKGDVNKTKTGIYQIDLDTKQIETFYDFSHIDGSRIFTIITDVEP